MRADPAELLELLRENYPQPVEPGGGLPLDHAAFLHSTAAWESHDERAAVGDPQLVKRSKGLFQVNQAIWERVAGPFDEARSLDDDSGLEYEVLYVRPVFEACVADLKRALAALRRAVVAGKGTIVFDPIGSLAEWGSIWWQYGAGSFGRWIVSPSFTKDATAAGFGAWALETKHRLEKDFRRRQAAIVFGYRASLANPEGDLVTFWAAESAHTRVDFVAPALASLGASDATRAEWFTGGDELRAAIVLPAGKASTAAPAKPAGKAASMLQSAAPGLLVSGLAAAAYFFLFEPDPDSKDGARRPHAEMVALAKSYATGVGGTWLLDKLKELTS